MIAEEPTAPKEWSSETVMMKRQQFFNKKATFLRVLRPRHFHNQESVNFCCAILSVPFN